MTTRAKYKHAFTLIESLVSISILLVGVTGAMTLTSRSISTGILSRNRLIAATLAQEAVEVLHNRRDNNYIAMFKQTPGTRWLDGINCGSPCVTVLDPNAIGSDYINNNLIPQTAGNITVKTLQRSTGEPYFFHQSDAPPVPNIDTVFRRSIVVTPVWNKLLEDGVSTQDQEVKVEVTVTWNERTGTRTLIAESRLFNWILEPLQVP